MHESTFGFTNDGDAPVEVILEPHGMPYSVPPGATLRIKAQGEAFGELQVETSDESVEVYAWPSSTAKVYVGSNLVDDYDFPVPEIQNGIPKRGLIDRMFRGTRRS